MSRDAKKSRMTVLTLLMLVATAGLTTALVVMEHRNTQAAEPVYHIVSLVIVGTLALAALGLAASFVIARGREQTGPDSSGYQHVWRVLGLVAAVVAVGLIVKQALVPPTFGQFGHYRGAALKQQAEIHPPVYLGAMACEECHPDEARLHAKDVHENVQCENCHGPGNNHVAFMNGNLPDDGTTRIVVPTSKDLCLTCHRRLSARPSNFPQIDPVEHFDMVEVNNADTPCFSCHSPHEPLFLDRKISESRLHPRISRCGDCHPPGFDETMDLPMKHPNIFRCSYCHGELDKDFSKRPHSYLGCRVCHQYYAESDSSGRIVKHRDVRFCLLCHQKRPFVTAERKPTIAWPDHLKDVAKTPEDEKKVCADCHREAFHMPFPMAGAEPGAEAKP